MQSVSDSYAVVSLEVVGADVSVPAVDEEDHEHIAAHVYEDDTDRPLLVKYETTYLSVYPLSEVPSGVLALPETFKDGFIRDRPILVAKEKAVENLSWLLK